MNPFARAIIIDTILEVMQNGPDNPPPKIEPTLRSHCKDNDRRVCGGALMQNTYNITLEWFESKNLFTYEDLHSWLQRHILDIPAL